MRLSISIIAAAILLSVFGVQAQTVGSSSNITGTNYFPVLVSAGLYQTNQVYQSAAYKTITLGNITSTNETVVLYYTVVITNGLVLAPGTSNQYIIGAYTNSFASGTNGGSWATTFNGTGATVPCPVSLGILIQGGNFTNTAYVP